jgi:hypothetical protein
VQANESALFRSYFEQIRYVHEHTNAHMQTTSYLTGGVASGLNASPASGPYQPRLYHVKGVRQARITPVDASVKSLNEGDVFVLDTREEVCVWTGPRSNRAERTKVVQVCLTVSMSGYRAHNLRVNCETRNTAVGRG